MLWPIELLLIVDDHALVRESLARLARAEGWALEVEGIAHLDERDPSRPPPRVVLLDIYLAAGVLGTVESVRQRFPDAAVVVLTASREPFLLRTAVGQGARALVSKSASLDMLGRALHVVVAGDVYIDPELQALIASEPSLSDREREVLRSIVLGHTSREIAGHLGLSVKTVETYRARLMTKLAVMTRAELVQRALALGYGRDIPA